MMLSRNRIFVVLLVVAALVVLAVSLRLTFGGGPVVIPPPNDDPCGDQRARLHAALTTALETAGAKTIDQFRSTVDKVAQDQGPGLFACPICAAAYRLNPVPRQWTMEENPDTSQLAIFCSCEHPVPDGSKSQAGTTFSGVRTWIPFGQTPAWLKNAVSVGG